MGIAHFARALEPDARPNNPALVDRLFNLLAYTDPPLYQSPPLDYGTASPIHSSVATADGSQVFTAHYYLKPVQRWSAGSPTPQTWPWSSNSLWFDSLALNPQGNRLLVSGWNRNTDLLDVATWSKLAEIPGPETEQNPDAPKWSTDGKRFLTGSPNEPVQIWDAETGAVLKTVTAEPMGYVLAWSLDESKVYLSADPVLGRSVVLMLDVTRDVPPLEFEHPQRVQNFLSTDPMGDRILTRSPEDSSRGTFWIWDRRDPSQPQFTLAHDVTKTSGIEASHPNAYRSERSRSRAYVVGGFTPDGQRILTAGTDLTVRLWDASPREMELPVREIASRPITQQVSQENHPEWSADGRRFMIRTRDNGCYIGAFEGDSYDQLPELVYKSYVNEGFAFLADPGYLKPLLLPQDRVTSGAVHPHRSLIALGTGTGQVVLCNLTTGDPVGAPLEHPGRVESVRFNGDGSRLSTRSGAGTVRVWEEEEEGWKLAVSHEIDGLSTIETPAVLGLEDAVVAVSSDRTAVLTSGLEVRRLPSDPTVEAVLLKAGFQADVATFSEDGSVAALGVPGERRVQILSAVTGESILTLPEHASEISSLAFRRDGRQLAVGCTTGDVRLWELPSGAPVDRSGISGDLTCRDLTFSPDGRLLATVFQRNARSYAQVWDVGTGRPITGPLESQGLVSRATFLDEGRKLVVWPQSLPGLAWARGWASVWDVSLSGGEAAPPWLSSVATSFAGKRLDEESLTKTVAEREMPPSRASVAPGEQRLKQFVEWMADFPGTRADSPFRPEPSEPYIDALIEQTTFALLDEAVRLRPHDPRALARRGVYRLFSGQASQGRQTLADVDVTRARMLAPEDAELAWYQGIAFEGRPGREGADAAYAEARRLGPLDLDGLLSVIEAQERFAFRGLDVGPRRELLDQALALAEQASELPELAVRLRLKRFQLNAESGRFADADEDWRVLANLEALPEGVAWFDLFEVFFGAAETAAQKLVDGAGGESETLPLIRSVAVLFELAKASLRGDAENYWSAGSILSLLVDVEDAPAVLIPENATWHYLDDGSDQGTAWREPEFDAASSWKVGEAKLGYGDPVETEIEYGPDRANKFPATYFRHAFEVGDDVPWSYLNANVVWDDGVIVYLNGEEVLRLQMPAGEVTFETYAENLGRRRDELAGERLSIDTAALREGRNVIAAEVHQNNETSTDLGFHLELLGTNRSPGSYFYRILERESSATPLQDSTIARIPRPFREDWQAILGASLEPEASHASVLPKDDLLAVVRLKGLLERWEEALALVNQRLEADVSSVQWLGVKAIVLTRLGRMEEAQAASQAAFSPPRDPALSERLIDLSAVYTNSLYERNWRSNNAADFPDLASSYRPSNGVAFDIRGMITIASQSRRWGGTKELVAVPVGQRAETVHFLAGAVWGGDEVPGAELARLVVHYTDGTEAERLFILDEDVVDWNPVFEAQGRWTPSKARLAWITPTLNPGDFDARRLSEVVWQNPNPEKEIESLEITAAAEAQAAFLVIGITLK